MRCSQKEHPNTRTRDYHLDHCSNFTIFLGYFYLVFKLILDKQLTSVLLLVQYYQKVGDLMLLREETSVSISPFYIVISCIFFALVIHSQQYSLWWSTQHLQ